MRTNPKLPVKAGFRQMHLSTPFPVIACWTSSSTTTLLEAGTAWLNCAWVWDCWRKRVHAAGWLETLKKSKAVRFQGSAVHAAIGKAVVLRVSLGSIKSATFPSCFSSWSVPSREWRQKQLSDWLGHEQRQSRITWMRFARRSVTYWNRGWETKSLCLEDRTRQLKWTKPSSAKENTTRAAKNQRKTSGSSEQLKDPFRGEKWMTPSCWERSKAEKMRESWWRPGGFQNERPQRNERCKLFRRRLSFRWDRTGVNWNKLFGLFTELPWKVQFVKLTEELTILLWSTMTKSEVLLKRPTGTSTARLIPSSVNRGRERQRKRCFFVVEARDAHTLHKIITKYVREGTTIFTDEWLGYQGLDKLGYTHKTICHKRRFSMFECDHDQVTRITTNHVERMWVELRKTLKFARQDQLEKYILLEPYRLMYLFGSLEENMDTLLRDLSEGNWDFCFLYFRIKVFETINLNNAANKLGFENTLRIEVLVITLYFHSFVLSDDIENNQPYQTPSSQTLHITVFRTRLNEITTTLPWRVWSWCFRQQTEWQT